MGAGQVRKTCLACKVRFKPARAFQKFCGGKCRRRVEHLRYIERYPDEKKRRIENLMEWKKNHPLATRVKRRFFPAVGMPTWLTGR
jgi:hypothetical protein